MEKRFILLFLCSIPSRLQAPLFHLSSRKIFTKQWLLHTMQWAAWTDEAFPFFFGLKCFMGILLDTDYHSLPLLREPCLVFVKSFSNFFDFLQLFCLVFKSFLLSSWILSLLHNSKLISWDITFHLGACLSSCIWLKLPFKRWPTIDSSTVPDRWPFHTCTANLKLHLSAELRVRTQKSKSLGTDLNLPAALS